MLQILYSFHSLDYWCNPYFQFALSLGIGSPPGQMDPKAFLLQKFNVTARQRVSSWFTVKFIFGVLVPCVMKVSIWFQWFKLQWCFSSFLLSTIWIQLLMAVIMGKMSCIVVMWCQERMVCGCTRVWKMSNMIAVTCHVSAMS